MIVNNAAIQQKKEARKSERLSAELVQALTSTEKNVDVQSTNDHVRKFQIFKNSVEKKHRVSELNDRIYRKKLDMF